MFKSDYRKKKLKNKTWILETNIDDMNSEFYPYLMELAFENGALDVFMESIIMKKNRPAIKLSVITDEKNIKIMEDIIFKNTSSFGIRKYEIQREVLERKFEKVKTKYGEINIKLGYKDGELVRYSPEYEDCKKLAKENGISVIEIYNESLKNIKK